MKESKDLKDLALRFRESGDPESFNEIYERCAAPAMAVIRRYCDDLTEREDVLQDTFVTVWQKIGDLEDPEKLQAWINVIAANTAIRRNMKKKPKMFSEIEDENEDLPFDIEDTTIEINPEANLDKKEAARAVEEIISTLPEDQRDALWMVYGQGVKIKDMAEALGVSENTIKSRLYQGRKKLESRRAEFLKRGIDLAVVPVGILISIAFREEAYAATVAAAGAAVGGGAAAGTAAAGATAGSAAGGSAGSAAGSTAGKAAAGITAKQIAAAALASILAAGSIFALRHPPVEYDHVRNRQAVQTYREILRADPEYFYRMEPGDSFYQYSKIYDINQDYYTSNPYYWDPSVSERIRTASFATMDMDSDGIMEVFAVTEKGSYLLYFNNEQELCVLKTARAEAVGILGDEAEEVGDIVFIPHGSGSISEVTAYRQEGQDLTECEQFRFREDRKNDPKYMEWFQKAHFPVLVELSEENLETFLGGTGMPTGEMTYQDLQKKIWDSEEQEEKTDGKLLEVQLKDSTDITDDEQAEHPFSGYYVYAESPEKVYISDENGINPYMIRLKWDEEKGCYRADAPDYWLFEDTTDRPIRLSESDLGLFAPTEEEMQRLFKLQDLMDMDELAIGNGWMEAPDIQYIGIPSEGTLEITKRSTYISEEGTDQPTKLMFYRVPDFEMQYRKAQEADPWAGVYDDGTYRYFVWKAGGGYSIEGYFPYEVHFAAAGMEKSSSESSLEKKMPKEVSTLTFGEPSRLYSFGADWDLCSLEFRNGRLIITNKQTGEAQDCAKTGLYPVFDMDEAEFKKIDVPALILEAEKLKAYTDAHLKEYTVQQGLLDASSQAKAFIIQQEIRESDAPILVHPGRVFIGAEGSPVMIARHFTRTGEADPGHENDPAYGLTGAQQKASNANSFCKGEFSFEDTLSERVPYSAEGKVISKSIDTRIYYENPAATAFDPDNWIYIEAEDEAGNLIRVLKDTEIGKTFVQDADGTVYEDLYWGDYVYLDEGKYPQLMLAALNERYHYYDYLTYNIEDDSESDLFLKPYLEKYGLWEEEETGPQSGEKADWDTISEQAARETEAEEQIPEWAKPLPESAYDNEANRTALAAYIREMDRMAAEMASGYRPDFSVFDINKDGVYEAEIFCEGRSNADTYSAVLCMQDGQVQIIYTGGNRGYTSYCENNLFKYCVIRMGYYEDIWKMTDHGAEQIGDYSISADSFDLEALGADEDLWYGDESKLLEFDDETLLAAYKDYEYNPDFAEDLKLARKYRDMDGVTANFVEYDAENKNKYLSGNGHDTGIPLEEVK